jgi:hypothetical protein
MKYPKIIFEPMTLEKNIDTIKWAYFESNGSLDVHSNLLNYFPELKKLEGIDDKNIIYKKIEEVVTNDYKKYEERIKSETERYNKIWESYNDRYFEALSKYLNANFKEDLKNIRAYVGLTPVFPRYLDTCSFSVATGLSDEWIISTCAHETCHFMWFNKWKELYPDCPRREYDSPYIPWQYSEMVVDPILNSKEINSIINVKCRAYDSFYEMMDNDKYVMDNLREIYNENISIEEKITKGYDYIKPLFEINKRK